MPFSSCGPCGGNAYVASDSPFTRKDTELHECWTSWYRRWRRLLPAFGTVDAVRRRTARRAWRTARARADGREADTARTGHPGRVVRHRLVDRAPRLAQRLDDASGLGQDGEWP